nr:MAG TPA: hypothetical protein [Bacteriophage sp.]
MLQLLFLIIYYNYKHVLKITSIHMQCYYQ